MAHQAPIKLIPRNRGALRRGQDQRDAARPVPGNPVSTRLESGIGNCFPGLECDLRNLERRFFPFLEMDIIENFMVLADVDIDGVPSARAAGALSQADAAIYTNLANELTAGRTVMVS